ncbi:MAG TPA: GNAT family N-acetyltransferase [Bacillota bacterium]
MNITIAHTEEERKDAQHIRMTVFVKEQNVPIEIELDEHDREAIHFVGYKNGLPIAASRLRFFNSFGKLERISVLKSYRGQSYGKQMIQQMEEVIKKHGYAQVKLNAQTSAVDFYRNMGYKVTSNEFIDANIPHVTMEKTLS